MNDQELRALAHAVLTKKQLDVWTRYDAGMSTRTIATDLRLSRATVRDHLNAATTRLRANGAPT